TDVVHPRGAQGERRVDVGALAPTVVERHARAEPDGPADHGAAAAADAVDEEARRLGARGHHGALPVRTRPAATHSAETIQNLMATCCSLSPASSKWWWMGAMRKRRLPPVDLK